MVATKGPKRTRKSRSGYIAFYKGHLIRDHILDNIIGAARRGLMTEAGEHLLLMPDTRRGPADVSGLREIGPFRKSDCLTLKQLINRERRNRGLRRIAKKRAKKPNSINNIKNAKTESGTQVSETDFVHNDSSAEGPPDGR
jgi:hypothetical protein